ncbi:MAG: hypothetical protein EPN85_01345 [Bacteroidetes bacterium]|nr:MAG: hypothetical protein EPN85_01345 [Bacteroidota bacterium]
MQVKIPILKEYISFRSEARNIESRIKKELKKNHSSVASLDFSEVVFISRGFADELLNVIEKFDGNGKKILFFNIKPEIKKLISIVKQSKEKIRNTVL